MSCDDFRGIAISPVISKVFEYCLIDRFQDFLKTGDNQFGFKNALGCSHAIFSVRKIIERFIKVDTPPIYVLLICQKHLTRLITAVCF